MATSASHLIQDQNLNILSIGATLGGKTGVTKADNKGGLGGRKALNDVSNSRNATVLRTKKDLSVSKTKSVVGGKWVVEKHLVILRTPLSHPCKQFQRRVKS
ncbi:Hypothetical predicted protein [Olea europaea subsp. europaea]|uniref:Uncharacterized protein n=1 Tax=Olea europaea subsp. europaea TaxID=158383 RepID=A0A8S0SFR3_OLEEU|nr:Hypothetical predicted protein [Olea europaea subsp. europaea]